jgi:poly(3-hydroxybutyrate) depolymerase
VGHYGVFNGSRFRAEIAPRIVDFMASFPKASRQVAKPRLIRSGKGSAA